MTDRSKTRIFPFIELNKVRDLVTGKWYGIDALVSPTPDIYIVKGNTLDSVTTSTLYDFVIGKTNVAPVAPEEDLGGKFYDLVVGSGEFKLNYNGTESKRFGYKVSGIVNSVESGNSNKFAVRLVDDVGGIFTGTTKTYAAGKGTGGAPSEIGFTCIGYGRAEVGSNIFLEVSKNFTGNCVIQESLITIESIN